MTRVGSVGGFVENRGQVDDHVKYYRTSSRHTVWLTEAGVTFDRHTAIEAKTGDSDVVRLPLDRAVIRQEFIDRSARFTIRPTEPLPGVRRYILSSSQPIGARAFGSVVYENVWPGVDVRFVPGGPDVEELFVVGPGARPELIRVAYPGADSLRLAADGSLDVVSGSSHWRQTAPRIYQETRDGRVNVAGRYELIAPNAFTFAVDSYDSRFPLIIDPTLLFSSYLGGADDDKGEGIAVDNAGNIYITGFTYSLNFPIAAPIQPQKRAGFDVFVTKLGPDGAMVYSTYIGGAGYDLARDIAVDGSGNAYVTGLTQSDNFPVLNAIQPTSSGTSDAFLLKITPLGGLAFATYLGGSSGEDGTGVDLDGSGNPYVVGLTSSPNFPRARAVQTTYGGGSRDAFLTIINATGTAITFSTYLGGTDADAAAAVAVGPTGDAYVTGATNSTDFPTQHALQNSLTNAPFYSAFVTRIDPAAAAIVYSTYLGGSATDVANDIDVDPTGSAYVVGSTASADFPVVNPFQATPNDAGEIFASKLSASGDQLAFSTYIGGNNGDAAAAVAVDGTGNVFITGSTNSSDFPVRNAWQDELPHSGGGIYSAFILQLSPNGSSVPFSTYHGGNEDVAAQDIALGTIGDVYVTGWTQADNLPLANPFQAAYGRGSYDAFVVKAMIGAGPGFSIVRVSPDEGGDAGVISVTAFGTGFQRGATIKLTKGARQVSATVAGVADLGGVLSAMFDLNGQERGSWDVVITNPDGVTATLPSGFTVVEAVRPRIWVEVAGRERALIGRATTYSILYGNTGNANAFGVPIWIAGIPKDAAWSLDFELARPPSPDPSAPLDFSVVPVHIETDDEVLIPLYVGVVPPAYTGVLRITITIPDVRQYQLRAWACRPWFQSPLEVSAVNCSIELLEFAFSEIVAATIPGVGCANAVRQFIINSQLEIFSTAAQTAVSGDISAGATAFSVTQIFFSGVEAALQCGQYAVPAVAVAATAVKWVNIGLNVIDLASTCSDIAQKIAESVLGVQMVTSLDPNAKYGSQGIGPPRYIAVQQPLRYTVQFENLASATAAAQEVRVTDQLDATVMDLSALRFGPVTLGHRRIFPVLGADRLSVDLDLRPDQSLIARLAGSLDPATNILTWHLSAIDPATGTLPSDPDVGLLPPNTTPPAGEGSVMFTVMPKPTVASGTQIRNRASIIFDVNPAIATGVWVNTLDGSAPSSQVGSLSSPQDNVSFPVIWSGTDGESGIRDFTVYASRDGAAFAPWIRMTTATTGTFTGEKGHSYAFYSVARDLAGNVEDPPAQADALTKIKGGLGALLWVLIGLGVALLALILYLIFR